jgi:PRTRC genetic system protein C
MSEEPKVRVFRYEDQTYEDPGPEFTNEDVRASLVAVFPELAKATIETTDLPDGRVEVRFVKRAGTKGGEAC